MSFHYICNWLRATFEKAEPVHYWVLSFAIVVGGGWSAYTYQTFKQRELAILELNETQTNLEKAKAELADLKAKIEGTDSSYIKIDHETFDLPNGNVGLIVNVLVQNTGTNDVDMKWKDSPLAVHRMDYKDGDKIRFSEKLTPRIYRLDENNKKRHFNNLYLFVGAKKELSFFVELSKEGLYYVTFQADTSAGIDKKLTEIKKSGVWFSSKYLYLTKKSNSKASKEKFLLTPKEHSSKISAPQ